MKLFSYRDGRRISVGCLQGPLGINIHQAVNLYCRTHPDACMQLSGHPATLLDWALGAPELIQQAADWVLETFLHETSIKEGLVIDLEEIPLLPPIPEPGKLICIAGNFPAPGSTEMPKHPIIFLKPSDGVIGHKQPIVIPTLAQKVACEVELGVVIGMRARHVPPETAPFFIAGYTIGNDLGDRVLEKRTSQWTSGKMFDTFTPLGPILVTPDELKDPGNIEMTTRVNGEIVQHGSTSQMFFSVPELVSALSELTTLHPGDIILCGSPKMVDGVPNPINAINPGDRIEVSIQGIGTLCNSAIPEEETFA